MSAEIYQNVRIAVIPGEQLSEIHGQPVLGTDPFAGAVIPEFNIGEVAEDFPGEALVDGFVTLRRISSNHGRSYEVLFDGQERAVVWGDEYGTIFAGFNTKGNNYTKPAVILTGLTFPAPYSVFGMQDTESILRMLKASGMLRKAGIETEAVCRISIPDRIPYNGELVPQDEFKKRLLAEVVAREGGRDKQGPFYLPDNTETVKVASYLKDTIFLTTVRAVQTPERLEDLRHAETKDEFLLILGRAFDFLNFKNKLSGGGAEVLDINNSDDWERYFAYVLPEKLGDTLAKLHNMGLVHGYTHWGNISTAGTLYDLDSVRGKPLGDKTVTKEDRTMDVVRLANDMVNLIKILCEKGYWDDEDKKKEPSMSQFLRVQLMSNLFIENFYAAYLEQTPDSALDTLVVREQIDEAMVISSCTEGRLLNLITQRLERRFGQTFTTAHNTDAIVDGFFSHAVGYITDRVNSIRQDRNNFSQKDLDKLIERVTEQIYPEVPFDTDCLRGYLGALFDFEVKDLFLPKIKLEGKDRSEYVRSWFALREASRVMARIRESGILEKKIQELKAALPNFDLTEASWEEPRVSGILDSLRDFIEPGGAVAVTALS